MSDQETSRREFCGITCRALVAGGAAALLQACGGGGGVSGPSDVSPLPVVNGTVAGTTVTVAVDGTGLAASGGAALVQSTGGIFLVSRSGDTFIALSSTCTHQQCTVSGISGQRYVCPCHGSTYSFSGQVQSGPAPRSLATHATSFADGVLTIAR